MVGEEEMSVMCGSLYFFSFCFILSVVREERVKVREERGKREVFMSGTRGERRRVWC